MTLRDVIRNLLYPPRCRLCGALCGWEEQVCPACREQLPQAGEFFREPEAARFFYSQLTTPAGAAAAGGGTGPGRPGNGPRRRG